MLHSRPLFFIQRERRTVSFCGHYFRRAKRGHKLMDATSSYQTPARAKIRRRPHEWIAWITQKAGAAAAHSTYTTDAPVRPESPGTRTSARDDAPHAPA